MGSQESQNSPGMIVNPVNSQDLLNAVNRSAEKGTEESGGGGAQGRPGEGRQGGNVYSPCPFPSVAGAFTAGAPLSSVQPSCVPSSRRLIRLSVGSAGGGGGVHTNLNLNNVVPRTSHVGGSGDSGSSGGNGGGGGSGGGTLQDGAPPPSPFLSQLSDASYSQNEYKPLSLSLTGLSPNGGDGTFTSFANNDNGSNTNNVRIGGSQQSPVFTRLTGQGDRTGGKGGVATSLVGSSCTGSTAAGTITGTVEGTVAGNVADTRTGSGEGGGQLAATPMAAVAATAMATAKSAGGSNELEGSPEEGGGEEEEGGEEGRRTSWGGVSLRLTGMTGMTALNESTATTPGGAGNEEGEEERGGEEKGRTIEGRDTVNGVDRD